MGLLRDNPATNKTPDSPKTLKIDRVFSGASMTAFQGLLLAEGGILLEVVIRPPQCQ